MDVLSGGRLIVGIGAGWNRPEYEAIGLPFDAAVGMRAGRLKESVAVLKGLFADGPLTLHGTHYRIDGLDGQPMARDEQQISGADKTDIVCHGARGRMQDHALCRQFLLDRTRHVSSPFGMSCARSYPDRAALFRASRLHLQGSVDRRPYAEKPGVSDRQSPTFS